ncbi:uncharacterized protein ARMOST_02006 [Armillaria ostoyae]|uniref:Uncharacterized protein n=1 Tax=Armillaria ostoyae TaxID=47428 RepID=A0A284QQJ6_ARMOS|nr:uncharacterized protein ARMOST_02006 [Armillaria ostoyae]
MDDDEAKLRLAPTTGAGKECFLSCVFTSSPTRIFDVNGCSRPLIVSAPRHAAIHNTSLPFPHVEASFNCVQSKTKMGATSRVIINFSPTYVPSPLFDLDSSIIGHSRLAHGPWTRTSIHTTALPFPHDRHVKPSYFVPLAEMIPPPRRRPAFGRQARHVPQCPCRSVPVASYMIIIMGVQYYE